MNSNIVWKKIYVLLVWRYALNVQINIIARMWKNNATRYWNNFGFSSRKHEKKNIIFQYVPYIKNVCYR